MTYWSNLLPRKIAELERPGKVKESNIDEGGPGSGRHKGGGSKSKKVGDVDPKSGLVTLVAPKNQPGPGMVKAFPVGAEKPGYYPKSQIGSKIPKPTKETGKEDSPKPVKVSREDLMRVLGNPKVDKPNTGGDGVSFNHWLWASKAPARTTEADSAGSLVQMTRSGVKESNKKSHMGSFRLIESAAEQLDPSTYKVVLIQEGLGNFRDAYFYAKESLQFAASNQIFEGKKMFINHPSTIDEQTRPERDVKDIGGHFENVVYQESSDGRGQLIGDLCVLPGQQYDWIRSLFNHDIDFKEKNPGKEFVGLSINANGAAEPKGLTEFIKETKLPESVLAKLNEALEKGIDTIKVVSAITDSESCDLVTSAGAGGKILQLL